MTTSYSVEEAGDKLKVTINIRRNWLFLSVYSLAIVVWIAMLAVVISYLLRGWSDRFVLTILLLLWLLAWFWLGRFLLNRWQYQFASRELIFIDDEQITLRRPVSVFGLTSTYDRRHVSRFYLSDKHNCPAFDYAYAHVYFGQSLDSERSVNLIRYLNGRYFPELSIEEDTERMDQD